MVVACAASSRVCRWILALVFSERGPIRTIGRYDNSCGSRDPHGALLLGRGYFAFLWPLLRPRQVVGVAVLFSILATGLRLEWQRIPNEPCGNEGIMVSVAGAAMYLPLEMSARLDLSDRRPSFYRPDLKRKHDVKVLCQISDSGTKPVKVSSVSMLTEGRYNETGQMCSGAPEDFCYGFPDASFGMVHSLRILEDPEPLMGYSRTWHESKSERADTRGTMRDGSACSLKDDLVSIGQCTAWRTLRNYVVIYAGSGFFRDNGEGQAGHFGLNRALDWLKVKLTIVSE